MYHSFMNVLCMVLFTKIISYYLGLKFASIATSEISKKLFLSKIYKPFDLFINEPKSDFQAELTYVDILENNDARVALPKVSDWPTFPQVFVNGELIGGADIVAQMHESGELKKLLDSVES